MTERYRSSEVSRQFSPIPSTAKAATALVAVQLELETTSGDQPRLPYLPDS